jgi:hypothetical protein
MRRFATVSRSWVDQPADAFQNRGLRFEGRWVGELERLRNDADIELKETGRWATTFTRIQCWGRDKNRPG